MSVLIKPFPKDFIIASCDKEFAVYSKFVSILDVFWEDYSGYGSEYSLYIFKTIL